MSSDYNDTTWDKLDLAEAKKLFERCDRSLFWAAAVIKVAFSHPDPYIAKYLLDQDLPINFRDNSGIPAFVYSIGYRNPDMEMLHRLIDAGLDIDQDEKVAFIFAASCPDLNVLKFFVEKGAKIGPDSKTGKTLLHQAAKGNCNTAILEYLIDHTYRYGFASEYVPKIEGTDHGRLALAVDSSVLKTPAKKKEKSGTFFTGTLLKPKKICDLLRGVSEIVTARFNNPNWQRLADPVITVGDDRMRFEGFSGCCSAYARVDLLPDAVEGDRPSRGTTNVDFNPAMLSALASVRDNDYVAMNIGAEQIELFKNAEKAVERKVSLPVRWLKGFVEIQAYQSRMTPMIEIPGIEARRFLRSIPRTKSRTPVYILPSGRGLRLSQISGRGGVKAAGLERLRVLENLVHYAESLRIYGDEESGASAWELVLPEARFHLIISPDVWRGFSGEGQVLTSLAIGAHVGHLDKIADQLEWESEIDVGKISRKTGASPEEIRAGLAVLGTRGLVGYDLDTSSYFHRVLPFDMDQVEKLQPRLVNARKLVADGKVNLTKQTPERTEAFVAGTDVEHFVRISETESKCTCPWYAKHQGERGPCKHVLAVQILLDQGEALKK